MSAEPDWTTLVDSATLAAALQRPQLRLLDARAAPPTAPDPGAAQRDYAQGHLPDAHFADLHDALADVALGKGVIRCRTVMSSRPSSAAGGSRPTARWWSMTRPMAAWRPHGRGGCCG